MSKGSSQRPFSVTAEDFSSKWEATFGRKSNVDNVQKTSGSDGSIESIAGKERGRDSSGDSTLSSDNKPSQ